MTPDYPRTFDEIGDWAIRHGVRSAEARTRFAQYGVLRAVATSRTLSRTLAFKGGNALDFIWQPNRSTTDLDFSLAGDPLGADQLRSILQRSLAATGRVLNLGYHVQSIKPWPRPPGKTFVTYEARIGYAFSDEPRLRQQLERGAPLSRIVSVDISINEVICATEDVPLALGATLCVCTLEDIIA